MAPRRTPLAGASWGCRPDSSRGPAHDAAIACRRRGSSAARAGAAHVRSVALPGVAAAAIRRSGLRSSTSKRTCFERVGVEAERGVLTFSLLKHTSAADHGRCVFRCLGWQWRNGNYVRPMIEAFVFAWLTMLAATYVLPHVLYRRKRGRWLGAAVPLLRLLRDRIASRSLSLFAFFQSLTEIGGQRQGRARRTTPAENIDALITAGAGRGPDRGERPRADPIGGGIRRQDASVR